MVTMKAICEYNAACGYRWFDPETMRWWGTRLLPTSVCEGPGGVYFVTSDAQYIAGHDRGKARIYTVRRFYKTGEVDTVYRTNDNAVQGDPLRFRTAARAKSAARRLARGEK